MVEEENKPKWLLELENRKRKPRLAHETGAGAPCLTCESACPGLDLHFWRKICKNCKCRGDSHDFDDDDFPQFELLFGPSVKNKRNRSVLLRVNDKADKNDKKQIPVETPFEWVPPNTTKELAADYMKALPSEKLPIKGSAGAALRKQQLQKQLPLHDIDHKACDGLSDQEKKEFEKYLDNLKNSAGQGKVSKLTTIRPFDRSLMTPANATDVQRFSPQHSQQLLNPNGGLNLRTPSSFIPKGSQSHIKPNLSNLPNDGSVPLTAKIDLIRAQHLQSINEVNPRLGQYQHNLSNTPNDIGLAETSNVPGTYHLGERNQLTNPNHTENYPLKDNPTHSELQYSKNPRSEVSNSSNVAETVPGVYHLLGQEPTNLSKQGKNLSKDNPTTSKLEYYKNPSSSISTAESLLGSGPYYPESQQFNSNKQRGAFSEQNPIDCKLDYLNNPSSSISNAESLPESGTYHPGSQQFNLNKQRGAFSEQNPIDYKLDYLKSPSSSISNAESLPESGTYHPGSQQFNLNKQRGAFSEQNPIDCKLDYLKNPSSSISNAESLPELGTYHPGSQQFNLNKQGGFSEPNPIDCKLEYLKNPSSIASTEYANTGATHKMNAPRLEKIGGQCEKNLEFSSDLPSNALLAEQMLSEALLPPSSVNAGDIVASSLDEKGLMYIREKLSDKYNNKNDRQMPMLPRKLDHISHHPSISSSEEIKRNAEQAEELKSNNRQYNESNRNQLPSQMPYTSDSDRLQAELITSSPIQSNVIHSEELNIQVFPEDAIGASVMLQNPETINQLQQEMEGMTTNVTKPHQCHKCQEDIHCGSVIVTAEKIKDAVWHPGCFVCSACDELLVDLVYFTRKDKLYCGRDFAELLEILRCFACDELIFVREYTMAQGHNYHVKHFCCWDCDIPLAGHQYTLEDDRPLCLPCYQKNYAKTCNACNNVIAADQQGIPIKNLTFHATDDCFCCFTCKKSLLGGQIAIKENKPLCSKECIAEFLHRKS